jgi:hypothetical protein
MNHPESTCVVVDAPQILKSNQKSRKFPKGPDIPESSGSRQPLLFDEGLIIPSKASQAAQAPECLIELKSPPAQAVAPEPQAQAPVISLKRWTPQEDKILVEMLQDTKEPKSYEEIAVFFSRSVKSITKRREYLKISCAPRAKFQHAGEPTATLPKRKTWSAEEDRLLLEALPLGTLSEGHSSQGKLEALAILLNRTLRSLYNRRHNLGHKHGLLENATTPSKIEKIAAQITRKMQEAEQLPPPAEQTFFDLPKALEAAKPEVAEEPSKLPPKAHTPWSEWDVTRLHHYWKLQALGTTDIATFMHRTILEIEERGTAEGLPPKDRETPTTKYIPNPKWNITAQVAESGLSVDEQHALAELTATRLNHLQENPTETSGSEKEAEKEINALFEVQRHIFSRAIRSRARRLASFFADSERREKELISIGESALFQTISRWDPAAGINFCRATVALNLERQMQHWIRTFRTITLPSALIQEVAQEIKFQKGWGEKPSNPLTNQRKAQVQEFLHSIHPDMAYVNLNLTHEDGDDRAPRGNSLTCGAETGHHKHSKQSLQPTFIEPEIEHSDRKELLSNLFTEISENERYAFCQYNGISETGEEIGHKNLHELSRECKVSAERIRQRIVKAKRKLLRCLARKGIKSLADILG